MKIRDKKILLDLEEFKKIEDIIFLDEPILTHLKRNEKHYLQYLVDTVDNSDFYLLIEVEESNIFEYLTKSKTLKSLILENTNLSFIIEQDFSGNVLNVDVTQTSSLDESYLPSNESFLDYEPTEQSYYFDFIEEFKSKTYLASLRSEAFYIKFAPNSTKYSDTIGLNELASGLLNNISSSFKSFLKADFFIEFEKINSNKLNLQNIFSKILPDLDFRMVDLKYGSFEIGLAVDKVMKGSIQNEKIKNWALKVGNKYKEIVLDDDYDKETVDKILDCYNEEDRKKIFHPIFKITENPNFSLQIKNSSKSNYKTIRIKDKSVIEKIVPNKIERLEIEEVKEYQIVNVTTVIEKKNSNKSIKLENTLFSSTDNTEVVLTNKDFKKYGFDLQFNLSVPLNIKIESNSILFNANYENLDFNTISHSEKMDEGMMKITSKIYEYILNKEE